MEYCSCVESEAILNPTTKFKSWFVPYLSTKTFFPVPSE